MIEDDTAEGQALREETAQAAPEVAEHDAQIGRVAELEAQAHAVGRPARQRTTTYGQVSAERLQAARSDRPVRVPLPLV